jgi:hypothetical protein
VTDTTPEFAALARARHAGMTPDMRMRIASDLFDAARTIVEASLPTGLTERDRRLALARRLYGNELPEAALLQFADYAKSPNPLHRHR